MMAEFGEPELTAEPAKAPRLFVSYSWTNQAHIDWVMQLATDLRAYGVDTVIDRWDLREGQDAHSFMEQSVRGEAIDKAILVCDRKYVDRANKREGGVGAESQVVTSSIYKDVEQTKFVAVVTESDDDGEAVLPNFLTSRIFIDFRNSEEYSERLQQLVRWVFDKPLYRKPDLGPRPEFINDQIDFAPIQFHVNSLQGHNSAGRRDLGRFLDEAGRQKTDFTVEMSSDEPNDETIYRGIKSLPPIISQIIGEFDTVLIDRELSDVEIDATIEYFGKIAQNYEKGSTSWSGDVTKFFGQFICTAVLSRSLKFRRFDTAESILQSVLIKMSYGGVTAETIPLRSLNTYLRSLEGRNERLKLRRLSLHSDIIKEICELVKIDLFEYMQADLILYFRQNDTKNRRFWWPDSLLYAADANGPLPLFARALQTSLRDQLMPLIGASDKNALEEIVRKIEEQEFPRISWPNGFSTVDVKQLANLAAILDTY